MLKKMFKMDDPNLIKKLKLAEKKFKAETKKIQKIYKALMAKAPKELTKYNKKKNMYISPDLKVIKGLTIYGQPVYQQEYRGEYDRSAVKQIAQDRSYDLQKLNPNTRIAVSMKFSNLGWRGGKFLIAGEPISLYDPSDSDFDMADAGKITEFRIFIIRNIPKKGGCDNKNNDCLYECLKSVIGKLPWKTPEAFKQFLKLPRISKVNVDYIKQIDDKIDGWKINVTGDHIFNSTKTCIKAVHLILKNRHYEINRQVTRVKGIVNKEKQILIYDKFNYKSDFVTVYDGKTEFQISKAVFRGYKTDPLYSPYILINKDDPKTMKETYDEFVSEANLMKKETNGVINMFKTGRDPKTAMKLFFSKQVWIDPEPIFQDEMIWLENAKQGALIYGEKYSGKGYKYDVCSMYPSIMRSTFLQFPLKRGEFKQLTSEEFNQPYFKYGIYRCVVSGEIDKRVFRVNESNHYTHVDLTLAKELKYNLELINDERPNALIYSDCLIMGATLFREFVDYLFEFKKKGIKRAKGIINSLWGALCQVNKISIEHYADKINDFSSDREIIDMIPIMDSDNSALKISFAKTTNYYETNYARVGPFLLSKGRQTISRIISPHIEHVKRVHTDGFISDVHLNIKTGNDIGELKYEGFCDNVVVKHCNSVQGDFKV